MFPRWYIFVGALKLLKLLTRKNRVVKRILSLSLSLSLSRNHNEGDCEQEQAAEQDVKKFRVVKKYGRNRDIACGKLPRGVGMSSREQMVRIIDEVDVEVWTKEEEG